MPSDSPDASRSGKVGRRGRKSRLAFIALVVAVLAVFHQSLLQNVYAALVVHQSSSDCRYGMVLAPSPECFDTAARLLSEGVIEQALVADQKARRAVQIGSVPEYEDWVTRELQSRGVPPAQIRVVNTEATTPHQLFRETDQLIRGETDRDHVVISGDTKSRYYRAIIDQALATDRASVYRVWAVPSKRTGPGSWWKNRAGVRQVMIHGLRLAFVLCRGESDVDPSDPYEHVIRSAESNVLASRRG